MQTLQQQSFQIRAAVRAARQLAITPETALSFCGQIAVDTNAATLATFFQVGPAARAVAALARKIDQEDGCWKNHPAISWNLILRCCTTPTG